MSIPVLDLDTAKDPEQRTILLDRLRDALFNVGFLYIVNHGVAEETIDDLASRMPALFDLPDSTKARLSKLNSPHFLGYSAVAEEVTLGKRDLREQFDYASELPVIYQSAGCEQSQGRDFSKAFWRLRGPNQWPSEEEVPGFKDALFGYVQVKSRAYKKDTDGRRYHKALSDLSYRFVHLVEEAFGIPVGTLDSFFDGHDTGSAPKQQSSNETYLCPQHRIKLVKYHVAADEEEQGVGPHKDSSGWLTFLHQVGSERGLEVLGRDGEWIAAHPIPGSLVVNFGNAFEAATEGAVRATVHRVRAPTERVRYSIPFFMGLPLDLKVSDIQSFIPHDVRSMRHKAAKISPGEAAIDNFIDPRWDNLGESQLRKWIRSHPDVGLKWYGPKAVDYYTN